MIARVLTIAPLAGNHFVSAELKEKGIAVVAANYRLSPKVTAPAYVEDAAVAWTIENIGRRGGVVSRRSRVTMSSVETALACSPASRESMVHRTSAGP